MNNYLSQIFVVFTVFLAVATSAFGQETCKPAEKIMAELEKPSLTFYYFDQ